MVTLGVKHGEHNCHGAEVRGPGSGVRGPGSGVALRGPQPAGRCHATKRREKRGRIPHFRTTATVWDTGRSDPGPRTLPITHKSASGPNRIDFWPRGTKARRNPPFLSGSWQPDECDDSCLTFASSCLRGEKSGDLFADRLMGNGQTPDPGLPDRGNPSYFFFSDTRYSTKSTSSCCVIAACRPAGMDEVFRIVFWAMSACL